MPSNALCAPRIRSLPAAIDSLSAPFVAPALRDAFSTLQQTVTNSTDCASLVEANGGRVRAVEGDSRLLKVTTPADLELVASWL